MDIHAFPCRLAVKAATVKRIPAFILTASGDAYAVDAGHHLVAIEVYH